MKINNCLKEWNAILEALGHGKQTILIRKYKTSIKNFLLYPTFSYANDINFLFNFKDDKRPFVEENALPNKIDDKTEIKYFAEVIDVIEKSPYSIKRLNKYHIWNKSHVDFYLDGKNGFIWLLRVYKLNKSIMAEPTHSMTYAHLKKEVDISSSKPILSDKAFMKLSKEIKQQ